MSILFFVICFSVVVIVLPRTLLTVRYFLFQFFLLGNWSMSIEHEWFSNAQEKTNEMYTATLNSVRVFVLLFFLRYSFSCYSNSLLVRDCELNGERCWMHGKNSTPKCIRFLIVATFVLFIRLYVPILLSVCISIFFSNRKLHFMCFHIHSDTYFY